MIPQRRERHLEEDELKDQRQNGGRKGYPQEIDAFRFQRPVLCRGSLRVGGDRNVA